MRLRSAYLVSAVLCGVLTVVPFLSVTVPPITDLPQQTAQMRLLADALGDPASPYEVQWAHPNKLGYLPLILTSSLTADPLLAARLAMALLGLLWVAAIHFLAWDAGRTPAAAAAASIFFFNHICYWGFLSFLIGFPVFALWSSRLRRSGVSGSWREAPGWIVLTALLYSAHVLWLTAGVVALFVAALLQRWKWHAIVLRMLWTLPFLAAVAVWYPVFTASGFVSATTYGPTFFERLHPGWWINSAFGGLRGNVETALLGVLLGWLALGAWQSRKGREHPGVGATPASPIKLDRWLAIAGGLFLAAALTLPSVQQHTIFFASRWIPIAAVLLTLAIPPPRLAARGKNAPPRERGIFRQIKATDHRNSGAISRIRQRRAGGKGPLSGWSDFCDGLLGPLLQLGFPVLLVASLAAATTATWLAFEDEELDGFHQALARLPPAGRLLGLDFVHDGGRIQGFPYYHLYAYGQALRGVELNRSFANQASSLVVYQDIPRPVPWTRDLDWQARNVRRSDIPYFDFVLIHGDARTQAIFLADERLKPLTGDHRWRLYEVR